MAVIAALASGAWGLLKRIPWQVFAGIAVIVLLWIAAGRIEAAFHDWKAAAYHDGELAERTRWQTAQADAGTKNAVRVVTVERQTTAKTTENNDALQAAYDDVRARYDRLRAQVAATVSGAARCSDTPGFPDATGCAFDEGARQRLLGLAEAADADAAQLNAAIDWYDEQAALDAKLRAEEAEPK